MTISAAALKAIADVTRAQFNPLIRPYLVLQIGFAMAITVIGIPFALIWFLGVGQWWARHYFEKLDCHLDDKKLRYRKGIFVTVEKTIPLENIQDVTFIEGPILRHFNLSTLKFETAGSGAGPSNDMQLIGIIDAANFRNKILDARDALKHRVQPESASEALTRPQAEQMDLSGIERRMDEIIALLKQQR